MKAAELPIPGVVLGDYPERRPSRDFPDSAVPASLRALGGRFEALRKATHARLLGEFSQRRRAARKLGGRQLREAARAQGIALRQQGFATEIVAGAFALVAVACERELRVRLYDTQVIAAGIVLSNRLAEMATGEGKTHAVLLAAAAAAFAGVPVHVITANDYLAARDAQALRPVYVALGVSVGTALQGQPPEARRAAYACDVTYCTAKELVFDYLRDGLGRDRDPFHQQVSQLVRETGQTTLLRGLCMTIIDEADSILIDEARVPLILSRAAGNEQQSDFLDRSLEIARTLHPGGDFTLDHGARTARLTDQGSERIEAGVAALPAVWRNRLHREEVICTALAALHLYRHDQHYLVRDGKVLIIDETTGRIAPGRAWSRGLHQLIEIKEGCAPTTPQVTAAQITYQRFFPRYLRLGGLSGTLRESRRELIDVYGLAVRRVPLRRPDRRQVLPSRLFPDRDALWQAVAERVQEMGRRGRPVLIGTDSVADSEALSRRLRQRGIEHAVLNARNDAAEAEIVARAGRHGGVTVATNMAGRGTDIPLGEGVANLGGLHVLCCQLNAARRIDRQIAGRCARQGDPGSVELCLALDAQLFSEWLPGWIRTLVARSPRRLPGALVRALAGLVQWRVERHHALVRRRLLQSDTAIDRRLSFGGPLE